MKIKLEGDPREPGKWYVIFDLVDNRGNPYSSHEYETSGDFESDIPLDAGRGPHQVPLVPRIKDFRGRLTIDGRDPADAINDRARQIGYPRTADPLIP